MRYLVLFLLGCGPYTVPDQSKAVELVWKQLYKQVDDPPEIQWQDQSKLDCDEGKAFYRGAYPGDPNKTSNCVFGVTWAEMDITQIALATGWKFSTTAMAHELYHESLYWDTGDSDAAHTDPGFGIVYGHPWGIVDTANVQLSMQGL